MWYEYLECSQKRRTMTICILFGLLANVGILLASADAGTDMPVQYAILNFQTQNLFFSCTVFCQCRYTVQIYEGFVEDGKK